MTASEQLFLILERNDPFPLIETTGEVAYFYKGCKSIKFPDGHFEAWDVKNPHDKYDRMSEGQTAIFIKTNFEK